MAQNEGRLWLWRKVLDTQAWQDANLWKVWCWCLIKASYKERWVSLTIGRGSTQVKVGPGQFIFGRKEASRELKMKPSSVRNRMAKLQKMENLDIQPDIHYSLVTIRNWVDYQNAGIVGGQATGQPEDRQGTGKGQPEDTNKKGEEGKEGKKKKRTTVKWTGEAFEIPPEVLEQWKASFANLDVVQKIAELTQWYRDNPEKQKKNHRAFLGRNMARENREAKAKAAEPGFDEHGLPFRNPTPEDIAVAYDIPLDQVVRIPGDD